MKPYAERNLAALDEHPVVRKLADQFAPSPFGLYLVGGCIRDALDRRPSFDDLDFTTDAPPDEIETLLAPLGNLWLAGKRFGTVGVFIDGQKVEVTTFRGETYNPDSRKPKVTLTDDLFTDLGRRDFTINAMALRVDGDNEALELIDPFGGFADIGSHTLRTPGEPNTTISDDPLRSIRAIRFVATRGFTLVKPLKEAIRRNRDHLDIVATERKTEEFRKIVKCGGAAVLDARVIAERLLVSHHLFGALEGVGKRRFFESDGVTVLAAMALKTANADQVLRNLNLSNDEVAQVARITQAATEALEVFSDEKARTLVREFTDEEIDRAIEIVGYRLSDINLDRIQFTQEDPRIRAKLPVDGHDVLATGAKGPEVGFVLRQVENEFISNPDLTREAALHIIKHAPRTRRAV